MVHVQIALAFLQLAAASPQTTVEYRNVWTLSWSSAIDSAGRVTRVPVLAWGTADSPVAGKRYAAPPEIAVVAALDDRYRQGRLSKQRGILESILSPEYYETDADGRRRDKAAAIAFAMDAKADSYQDAQITIRTGGNVVVLAGEETVTTNGVEDRALFTHAYSRGADGDWRLVTVTRVRAGR